MHIINSPRAAILKKCRQLIYKSGCKNVVTLNSLMVKRAWGNTDLTEVIKRASMVTADSIGVYFAYLILEFKNVSRYPGIEMMEDLVGQGWRVFFLGGRKNVVEAAVTKINDKYSNANICGVHHGYFTENEEEEIISKINALKPDIVFVGLDVPRQEMWIDSNKKRINAGLMVGVGGSFDVICGNLPRAPRLFRITGIEWLWRLIIQPWRFKRIIKLPVFIMEVFWRFFLGKQLVD